MNSSHQGNSQGGSPENSTPASPPANQQRGNAQNFVLVDSELGLDIGNDPFVLGEVRRVDRSGNRQSGTEGQSQQQGGRNGPDTSGSTGT